MTEFEDHIEEAEPSFIEIAPSRIFEGQFCNKAREFDALTITLDASAQSDLNWVSAQREATAAIEHGLGIFWTLDLGLFHRLRQPLTNQGQFLALALALEHFRDSLWAEFKNHTIGVSIYRGAADFSATFSWDAHQEQNLLNWLKDNGCSDAGKNVSQLRQTGEGRQLLRLFCRDVAVEYLSLLASRLPEPIRTYLFLDVSSFNASLSEELHYLNPERLDRLHLALRNPRIPFEAVGWGSPTSFGYIGKMPVSLPQPVETRVGICIPPMQFNRSMHYEGFNQALAHLQRLSLPYRVIAENSLTARWDGLDYLLYSPSGLSSQGKRKLQGFCAAGGTVVSIGNTIGLSPELTLHDWLQEMLNRSTSSFR